MSILRSFKAPSGLALFLALVAAICAQAAPPRQRTRAQPSAILVEDFEDGISAWTTNDGDAGADPEKVRLCSIHLVSPGAPGVGGARCALIEFNQAENNWASVTTKVQGALWAKAGCNQLSLSLKGDGGHAPVRLVFRVVFEQEKVRKDLSYFHDLSLEHWDWRKFTIPLSAFKSADGRPLGREEVAHASMLQFVQSGRIERTRFFVDDLRVERGTARIAGPPARPSREIEVALSFDRVVGVSRLQIGVNLPARVVEALDDPAQLSALSDALSRLTPCTARLQLSDFYDFEHRRLDLNALERVLVWVRKTGATPLICFDLPAAWAAEKPEGDWGERHADFVQACRRVVQRQRGAGRTYYELFDEPLLHGQFADVTALTSAYNALTQQIVREDPEARIGGPGLASPWQEHLRYFLREARTLHFLSFHFYGTHNGVTTDRELFDAAVGGRAADLPHQLSFRQVRELARRERSDPPEIFVTKLAANSLRSADGRARDSRCTSAFGAAWLAASLLPGSPHVDKAVYYRLFGDGWGLVAEDGAPLPPYQAALWARKFAPRGSTVCEIKTPAEGALAAAWWTGAARHAFVVHGAAGDANFIVKLSGAGHPRAVQLDRFDERGITREALQLPGDGEYSIRLQGPGVAVLHLPAEH